MVWFIEKIADTFPKKKRFVEKNLKTKHKIFFDAKSGNPVQSQRTFHLELTKKGQVLAFDFHIDLIFCNTHTEDIIPG